ncbi:MAG: polysaccharide biosynthesis C-terminal domain-containing protein [Candidatus Sumerlaeota bacterium]
MLNDENDPGVARGEPSPARSVQDTVLRNSALLGIVFVFNLFAGLITSSLLTRLLGRDLYGIYGNYFRLYSWLATISAFILPPVVVRYVAELIGAGRVGRTWRLLKVSLYLQALNILVVFAGYFVFAYLTKQFGDAGAMMLAAIFIAAIGQCFGQLWESFLRGFQDFRAPALANFAGAVVRLIGYSLLFFAAIASVNGTMWVFASGNIIYMAVLIVAVVVLHRARPDTGSDPVPETGLRKRIIEYAGMMGIGGLLSMVVWYNIETFMIAEWWKGKPGREAELAFYTLAITLSALPVRIGKMMSQALLPAFSELYGSGEMDRLRRGFHQATVLSTIVGAFLCALGVSCAVPFIRLLYPDEMLGAVVPFQLMLIPVLFMSINHAGSAALSALEWQRFYLVTTIILVPINLALDWWLVPRYGATGGSIVNAIMQSAAVLTGLYYICVMRKIGFPIRKTAGSMVAAAIIGAAAYAFTRFAEGVSLHDVVTLAIIAVTAPLLYVVLLRVLRVVGEGERASLLRGERLLPAPLRGTYRQLIAFAAGK